MEERKHTIQDLDEYIRQGEPEKQERGAAWQVAIGLQQVDGLKPSDYLIDTARQHIDGDITIAEAKNLIDTYYKSASARNTIENERTEEADKVSARITEILSEKTFSLTPTQLTSIHRRLFDGTFKFAGQIRDYNITKSEWVLKGDTVFYASCEDIKDTLEYDIENERKFSYSGVPVDDAIKHLVRFCANLWQIHPFGEGNTRTTAVFMIKYMRSLGLNVVNDTFAKHSWFFRNALVRANYKNVPKGIDVTTVFLERFFRNMLIGENNRLLNREMHVDWNKLYPNNEIQSAKESFQSANSALNLSSKCKSCTLEELAVLRVMKENPNATQKEIAFEIHKSERTVKSITISLQEKGVISRVNGKRNGYWKLEF